MGNTPKNYTRIPLICRYRSPPPNCPLLDMADEFPDDSLPPEAIYESRESLVAAINEWAAPRGYAFVVGRSRKSATGRVFVEYVCDRHSPPLTLGNIAIRRRRSARGTNCPFSIIAKESLDRTSWHVGHRAASCSYHNHSPSFDILSHPAHRSRSFTPAINEAIQTFVAAAARPRDIYNVVQGMTPDRINQMDLRNRITIAKRALHNGQSPTNALLSQLQDEGFIAKACYDENNHITAFLFAHKESLAYLSAFPDLLLLDCTYKTNRYNMPLLDIIGVDSCNKTFCVAFALLSGESELDFLWAIESLKSIYEDLYIQPPKVILTDCCKALINVVTSIFSCAVHLLCLWHANKAVQAHCHANIAIKAGEEVWRDFFQHWQRIIYSKDEASYEVNTKKFNKAFKSRFPQEVGYIYQQWLNPYRKRLVKAWVDQYTHFNTVVTSRVEGVHFLLKLEIKTSLLDLFDVWRSIQKVILKQLTHLRQLQSFENSHRAREINHSIFANIYGLVSHYALRQIEAQRQKIQQTPFPVCTGVFTRVTGLPCAHELQYHIKHSTAIAIDDIHTHWRLYSLQKLID
jgi:hypothetical protein